MATMEVSCVTMAKGAGSQNVHGSLCNGMVRVQAQHGQTEEAERWMALLKGGEAKVETLNALLAALIARGDFEKAEDWFQRLSHGALYPEMAALRPERSSFDVLIQGAAALDDLARAERYLFELERRGERPHSESFRAVIKALLRASEPRRAHLWMQDLVNHGCAQWSNYAPEVVRQRGRELRQRRGNVEEHLELVLLLVRALAAIQNTATAGEWLSYLVRCGVAPSQSPETWDAVRSQTPPQLLPARLYAEEPLLQPSSAYEAHPLGALQMWRDRKPLQLPVLLSGETEEDRQRYLLQLRGSEALEAPGEAECSPSHSAKKAVEASTRAESASVPVAKRPGSQGLRKALEMKRRHEQIAQANRTRQLCLELRGSK